MGTQLSINVLYGNAQVDDNDRDRAEAAALAVLAKAGTTAAEAFAEFKRHCDATDDYDNLTGLAAVWAEAQKAADNALTEGWHDPDGASCTISA